MINADYVLVPLPVLSLIVASHTFDAFLSIISSAHCSCIYPTVTLNSDIDLEPANIAAPRAAALNATTASPYLMLEPLPCCLVDHVSTEAGVKELLERPASSEPSTFPEL